MSKISIEGNASGTGTFTITSPNSNSNFTLTLPQSSGEISSFASGTVMLFVQTNAPTGWTKSTANNDKALRVVSGSASTGGSVAFTTAFASGLSSGATTLTTSEIPAHNHTYSGGPWLTPFPAGTGATTGGGGAFTGLTINNTGGGGSHTHTIPSFAVEYVDVIIATKD